MLKSLLTALLLLPSYAAYAADEPSCEKVLQADLHFDTQTGQVSLLNSPLATTTAKALIGLGRLEKSAQKLIQDKSDMPYFLRLANAMDLSIDSDPEDVKHLPTTGAVLVTGNHPHHGTDGIAIAALLSLKRNDVKIVLNEALRGVPGMPENAIFIDMTDSRKSFAATRQMIRHLDAGGALVAFPSAELSQKVNGWIVDPQWNSGMIAMLEKVKKQKVTIISAFVEGRPDFAYRLARKIWDIPGIPPKVAAIFTGIANIRALSGRVGQTLKVSFSAPVTETRLARIRELYPDPVIAQQKIADYLRLRSLLQKQVSPTIKVNTEGYEPIADEIPTDIIQNEIQHFMRMLSDNTPANENSGVQVFVAKGHDIPHVVKELGRLREITFRDVGEGSGKARDNDQFDADYHHLIAWDKATKKIIGAYRVGFLKDVIEKYGFNGVYSNQFVNYSSEFRAELLKCIELGRSFVIKAYQRRPIALPLLLNGIAKLYTENPTYEYLIGMVSISNLYSDHSKIAMIRFLNQFHQHPERLVTSKNPPSLRTPITEEEWQFLWNVYNISDANSFAGLDELVQDIEGTTGTPNMKVPPLVKIYPDFGVRFAGFNVDPDFNTTDGFIAVHLPTQPPPILKRISKMATR